MTRQITPARVQVSQVASILLSATLVVAILYFAKVVLIPVALAVMVTFILSPLVTRLDRWGVRRIIGVLAVVTVAGVLSISMLMLVSWQLHSLANDLPNYKENIRQKLAMVRQRSEGGVVQKIRSTFETVGQEPALEGGAASEAGQPPAVAAREPWQVRIVPKTGPEETFYALVASLAALTPVLEGLATGGLSLILMIFMLIRRENLRNRIVSLTTAESLTTMTKALDDAGRRISRFLLMQLIINGTFGVAVGAALLMIGVPYALLWGLCAAVLRYIPYIGPCVAAILPITVSLITSPGWTQVLLVFGLFLILELISNNVMEPWLYGQGIGISEVALLVSAAFWTWIWGPVGLVLSTPLTVCLAVSGKYVPALSVLDRLLGDRDTLRPHAALLQRLLAKDGQEASKIVRQYCKDHHPDAVYDHVLVPALSLARRDRDRGPMDAEEEKFILKATREILDGLAADRQAASAEPRNAIGDKRAIPSGTFDRIAAQGWKFGLRFQRKAKDRSPGVGLGSQKESTTLTNTQSQAIESVVPAIRVIGCAAHKEVEELTLRMLDHLVQASGIQLDIVSTRTLPSEIVERVRRERPGVVVIGVLPPGGLVQAHYLCKLLRKRFPQLGIVIGYWGMTGSLDRTIMKFRAAGAQYITTTLVGAKEHVVTLAKAASPNSKLAPSPILTASTSSTVSTTQSSSDYDLLEGSRAAVNDNEVAVIADTSVADGKCHG